MGEPIDDTQTFSVLATIEFIDSLEKTINDLSVYTRRLDFYPFDTVAGETLSKAFALSRAAILLIQHGFPDEAFGLCRSLYEVSMYLRYITQQEEKLQERASKFLEFGVTSKAFWFDILDKGSSLTESEREEIERYKAENQIPDDPKRVTQNWSGGSRLIEKVSKQPHPLDEDSWTETSRLKDKAIAYTDASCYVHCTQPGLNSHAFRWKEPIVVGRSSTGKPNTESKACIVIRIHLRAVVRYCLFGTRAVSLAEFRKSGSEASNGSETVHEQN